MSTEQPKTKMNIKAELFNPKFRNDKIFSDIYRDYIKLPMKESVAFKNKIFEEVIKGRLMPLMKRDQDFEKYFKKAMFGGSCGKDIKVCSAYDYKLNIIIELPINYTTKQVQTNIVNENFIIIDAKIDSTGRDKIFCQNLMDGNYLNRIEFYHWICGVCSKAIERYRERYGQQDYIITTRRKYCFEIDILSKKDSCSISFLVVPSLIFYDKSLQGFREPIKHEWLAVDTYYIPSYIDNFNVLWRPSFYEDEKEILSGPIKSFIKMLKKLRDSMKWTDLENYFIETLFLHELDNEEFKNNYEHTSRTAIFIYMLKRLQEVIQTDCLLYYWNQNVNFFDYRDMLNIEHELYYLISSVEDEMENDPKILLNYFSNSDDNSDNSYDDSSESDNYSSSEFD